MHPFLLHTHNLLRWLVLALGALALIRAAQGIGGERPYAAARRAGVFFMASLHLQVLLGLLLYMVSPFVRTAMRDMDVAMGERSLRLFVVEHPMMMVAAAVLMTIGGIVAKNAANDASRHRKALVFIGITLLLILWGIPWQRPLLPGLGS